MTRAATTRNAVIKPESQAPPAAAGPVPVTMGAGSLRLGLRDLPVTMTRDQP